MVHPTFRSRSITSIEPLEDRIAPALLVNGANLLGGSSPSTGETSVGDHSALLVKVLSGQALVWFDGNAITSISFGPGASLEIHGDVFGDIIGNLTASGRLSDSDNDPTNGNDGGVLLPNTLLGLKTFPLLTGQDGTLGSIITGGAVQKVSISGKISGIYAGDGAFRAESSIDFGGLVVSSTGIVDINPVEPGVQNLFFLDQSDGLFLAGAGINNIKITNASALEMYAGNGGAPNSIAAGKGFAGGSIANVTIENAFVPAGAPQDTPSYHLIAGDGQAGKKGGAGGSIGQVIEKASFGPVTLHAGNGGVGLGTAGGMGGDVANLDMQSASARYTVTAGDGGAGTPGGAGGRLLSNNFANRTPVSGVILSGDFTGDGVDDVLVADAGSGQMVISTQGDFFPATIFDDGNGIDFQPVVQFTKNAVNTVLIDGAGSTPISGAVVDVDSDGDLDFLIAYKNSSSLGIFINQGKGVFYDASAEQFTSTTASLGFTPQKLTVLNSSGSALAITENSGGKGLLHLATGEIDDNGNISYAIDTRANVFATPIADVAGGYVGFTNGTVASFDINDLQAKNPFIIKNIPGAVDGGIDAIDLDSSGQRLLALSTIGRTVTVFDATGLSPAPLATIQLNTIPGRPLIAHFIHDSDPLTEDDITVLTAPTNGSEFAVYNPVPPDADPNTPDVGYQLGTTFASSSLLKNFVPVYGNPYVGIAALASSLSQFTFVKDFLTSQEFALPFASKSVSVFSGRGGDGLDLGTKLGKGGAGGSIAGLNADAQQITVHSGDGGNSQNGAAGAGGNISNPATFLTASGGKVSPALLAEGFLEIKSGNGGTPQGLGGKSAAGGAGGSVIGITATLTSGDITLTAGIGGDGKGGAGGSGGSVMGTSTTAQDGNLIVIAGAGGAALSGAAASGAGGNIGNLTHVLTLDSEIEKLEHPYYVTLTAGAAGVSSGGLGGSGGNVTNISLKLDGSDDTYPYPGNPPLVDAHRDSTVHVTATAGAGGQGLTGGLGGSIRDFSSESFYDQEAKDGIHINFVVMNLTAGAGGVGTAGSGGAGGNVLLGHPISGVTSWDPDAKNDANGLSFDPTVPALSVTSGAGGDGTVRGGAGGNIAGLIAQNSPFMDGSSITITHLVSALVQAGHGGNGGTGSGGKGGDISGALIGVNDGFSVFQVFTSSDGGFLVANAGTGGDSASGKGGAGGAVKSSEFGLVSSYGEVGLLIQGGSGGQGAIAGGIGGAISGLRINTPQSTDAFSALIYAGHGGAATTPAGVGGRGGDINSVLQAKDVNSSINLLQAGNGGDNLQGTAGAGGNVINVHTVGFIGRPSDNGFDHLGVFDTVGSLTIAQGVFAGRGGLGQTSGVNGSVQNIQARQIAAIAAAVDINTGLFAVATKVSKITADLIGFDAAGDNTFDDINGGTSSPHLVVPADGFILATSIASVTVLRQGYYFPS
jgi:hypothetical protein